MDFDNLFQKFSQLKIGVIGDIMLDTYWWGKVDRISPEAPVPVIAVTNKEERIGGAANVALNLQALNANVFLLSVLGKDADGRQLSELVKKKNIDTSYLVNSEHRITTNKIRIISRNQHMMRLDAEITDDILNEDEDRLLDSVKNFIETVKPDVIILEDYNKGVLTENSIKRIIALCNQHNIIVTVDPKRKNFFSYAGVSIFKPNLKEVKDALNIISDKVDVEILKDIHLQIAAKLQHKVSLITLSEKGVFYQSGKDGNIISSHVRNVADVSGAGDTVIAVASMVYAATKNVEMMAAMANIAGGLVCEEVGTVAIDKIKLLDECKRLLS
jgi:rfaE bifunctional protein kinase chain/domain